MKYVCLTCYYLRICVVNLKAITNFIIIYNSQISNSKKLLRTLRPEEEYIYFITLMAEKTLF